MPSPPPAPDFRRVAVQTHRGREAELGAERRAVVVVGQVGVLDSQLLDRRKLPLQRRERFNECKTSNLHVRLPFRKFPGAACVSPAGREPAAAGW